MPNCKQCGKPVPEGQRYCDEKCLRKYIESKNSKRQETQANEGTIWQGQDRRKRAIETILNLAIEKCPIQIEQFTCLASYNMGISLRKITEDYLTVLLGVGVLKREGNILTVTELEKES